MINTALQCLDRSVRLLVSFVVSIILVKAVGVAHLCTWIRADCSGSGASDRLYWAIYRPDLFPVFAAFALGLWQDILVGSPSVCTSFNLLLQTGRLYPSGPFFMARRSA